MARRSLILSSVLLLIVAPLILSVLLLPLMPASDRVQISPVSFSDLRGWAGDDHAAALATFQRGCPRLMVQPADRPFGPQLIMGQLGDWQRLCQLANTAMDARAFFEQHFVPHAVSLGTDPKGLFTGYYEPLVHGQRSPDPTYSVPLYRRPPELVTVDLGEFRDDLKGRRIAGSVTDGRLKPFASRAAINEGELAGRGLELLWLDSAVDKFFLQIQGSGRVALPDGSTVRIGYDGPNGHPYRSLGRLMVERGLLERDGVSMQSIRSWLDDNPDAARRLMEENPSYIFFREIDGPGPIGAQGVALTPERSLAVDRTALPLGAPIWLETSLPSQDGGDPEPWQRLMVAQDTGGAIRGAVRGDIFFGFGPRAEALAGRMANRGRYYLLLPREISGAPALTAARSGSGHGR